MAGFYVNLASMIGNIGLGKNVKKKEFFGVFLRLINVEDVDTSPKYFIFRQCLKNLLID